VRRRTLHSGPSQKTWSSLWSEVAAFSGGWVVRPDLLGDVLDDPAGKGLTGRGEGFPGWVWRAACRSASALLRRSSTVRARTGRTGSRGAEENQTLALRWTRRLAQRAVEPERAVLTFSRVPTRTHRPHHAATKSDGSDKPQDRPHGGTLPTVRQPMSVLVRPLGRRGVDGPRGGARRGGPPVFFVEQRR